LSQTESQTFSGVSETLLVALYLRAKESQRPDALLKDEKAVALVKKISDDGLYDFNRMKSLHLTEANELVVILRNREFDRYARDFLRRRPDAVAVHIGCGLDSRFERVAERNGQLEWYDLDLPHVIDLRRQLIGGEGECYRLLGCSVLEDAWLEVVSAHGRRPFLFLAEGVFMYLERAQVKSLVVSLREHFPGAELVFDAYSPIHLLVSNLQTARFGLQINWGIWHGQEIERWGEPSTSLRAGGVCLLDEWSYLDAPEPRVARLRWLSLIESLFRTMRIYHFQLGKAVGWEDRLFAAKKAE
jgi:O-methyltransferase involved in polyketide biosynthesis